MRLRTGLKKIPVALLLAVLLSCSSPTDPNHDLAAARTRGAERGPI
jgi:hypothetical protein